MSSFERSAAAGDPWLRRVQRGGLGRVYRGRVQCPRSSGPEGVQAFGPSGQARPPPCCICVVGSVEACPYGVDDDDDDDDNNDNTDNKS